MRKWTIMFLAIVLLFSFAACSKPPQIIIEKAEKAAEDSEVQITQPTQTGETHPQEKPAISYDNDTTEAVDSQEAVLQQSSVTELPIGEPYAVDINHDGDEEEVTVYLEQTEMSSQEVIMLSVSDGDEVITIEVGQNCPTAYFCVNEYGDAGVIISFDPLSDDWVTMVYTFDGTTPIEAGCVQGRTDEAEPEHIKVSGYIDVLGTWWASAEYAIEEEFQLELDGLWMIKYNEYDRPITSKKDVPAEFWVDGHYENDVIPAGSLVWPVASDGESLVYFEMGDGRTGRISYTFYCFTYIEGILDEEWFDGIGYSG